MSSNDSEVKRRVALNLYTRPKERKLAVVPPKPRTLICSSSRPDPERMAREGQHFANEFGAPVTIITPRGRKVAYREPSKSK